MIGCLRFTWPGDDGLKQIHQQARKASTRTVRHLVESAASLRQGGGSRQGKLDGEEGREKGKVA